MNKDNKFIFSCLTVFTVVIIIGGLISIKMSAELEAHPEITEVGGPPVITNIFPMAVVVFAMSLVAFIVLWWSGRKKDIDDKEDML